MRCKEIQKTQEATYLILGSMSSCLEDLKLSWNSYVGVCSKSNQCREMSVFVTLKNNITQILYSSSDFVNRKVLAIKTLDFHLQPTIDQCH
jgi:hypothetical protein